MVTRNRRKKGGCVSTPQNLKNEGIRMDKFVCKDCGRIFDVDTAIVERVSMYAEYWGRPLSWEEKYLHCPDCKSDDHEEYYGDLEEGDNIADEVNENEVDEDEDEGEA